MLPALRPAARFAALVFTTPAENPQVAVTVFLERGVGATHAAPLASKILDLGYVQRDKTISAITDTSTPPEVATV